MRCCEEEELLHAAVVAIGVLEAQTHLGSVLLEVEKLFGVESSTSLPAEEIENRGSVTMATRQADRLTLICFMIQLQPINPGCNFFY